VAPKNPDPFRCFPNPIGQRPRIQGGVSAPHEHFMKAARIHQFGPPDVILIEEIPRPTPGPGAVLVRVGAAGVGPWDALIREKKSEVPAALL